MGDSSLKEADSQDLRRQYDALRARLEEAEETLNAIRSGSVDALVVWDQGSERVYTLEGAEHPYRVVVEVMNEGVVTVSDAGMILYANSRFAELVNAPLSSIIGSAFRNYIAAGFQDLTSRFLSESLEGGGAVSCNMQAPDGREIKVNLSARALEMEGLPALCVVVTDLTEMVAATETRLRYASILENTSDAIIAKDLDGRITTWNAGAERMYGYSVEEAIGLDFALLAPKERQAEFQSILEKIRQGERVEHFETYHFAKSGQELIVSLTVSPIKNEDGELSGYSIISRDVTAQRMAEIELALHRDHLEELVGQRTEELEHEIREHERVTEMVRNTAEELKRSNRDLEQFAYVASHDLQEPLRQVTGFISLLERQYYSMFDERALEYFGFITEGVERMSSLIKDLLAYSRVNRASKVAVEVDLNESVKSALQNLRQAIGEKDAQIEVSHLPKVTGSPTLLSQVFQNLIANSIKFRSEGKPLIEIGAEKRDTEWLVWVKDNGIGFSQDSAERIFMLFQRLHARDKYEGTGIGLSICKRIIEQHGGRIWAESALGQGATFYFTLPLSPIRKS